MREIQIREIDMQAIEAGHWSNIVKPAIDRHSTQNIAEQTLDFIDECCANIELESAVVTPYYIEVNNLIFNGLPWDDDAIRLSSEEAFAKMIAYAKRNPNLFSEGIIKISDNVIGHHLLLSCFFNDNLVTIGNSTAKATLPSLEFTAVRIMTADGFEKQDFRAYAGISDVMLSFGFIKTAGYDIRPDYTGEYLWRAVKVSDGVQDIDDCKSDQLLDVITKTCSTLKSLSSKTDQDPEIGPTAS